MMPNGGALLTLTYGGSIRVMPNYNVMGVAKAALEASVRYSPSDFGPQNIRVQRDLGRAGAHARGRRHRRRAPDVQLSEGACAAAAHVSIEEVGGSALYLLSDLSSGVTGEIHYVDSGYNIISMPRPDVLKAQDAAGVTGEEA